MNLYFELLKMPIFTVEDVNKYYDNIDSARSAIKRLMKKFVITCTPASVVRPDLRLPIDFK